MAKLGLPRHRYTLAILSGWYVISAVLLLLYCIVKTFYAFLFVVSLIHLIVGCLGIYALYKENGTTMRIYGIVLVSIVINQVLQIILLLVCMFIREKFINDYLKEAMDSYYKSTKSMDRMDEIQNSFECCGRETYKDWDMKPPQSCYYNSTSYYTEGCVDALSPFILLIFIGLIILLIVSIIFLVYAALSAFELVKVYKRWPDNFARM